MKRTPLRKISAKQSRSNRNVHEAKAKVLQRVLEENGYYLCESCGVSTGRLDCSHSIPISKRKDLEAEEKLIYLQCPKCHEITEHGLPQMKNFTNYRLMIQRIKEFDNDYYNRLINKI